MTTEEQIEAIQKEIRETPYHKGTEHHIGMLRARIARLKDRLIETSSRKSGGGGGYAVKKQGDATIVLVGPPSVGKSTLINKLTNAQSKVAPYAFTTVTVIPGMMEYKDARIQILDVPGLIEGAEEGKGRGREVISVVRGADLLVIMTQIDKLSAISRIKNALERNGIRIDKVPPKVQIEKKMGGGLLVHSNIRQEISKETIKEVAREFSIKNGEISLKEKLTFDRLTDAFSTNRVYIPSITVINKADLLNESKRSELSKEYEAVLISAENGLQLDSFKETMWKRLNFLRVFLIGDNEIPSFDNPLVVITGKTLFDVAEEIGTDFAADKTRAKIWGNGAKFPGQEVSLSAEVKDGMQIKFI